MKNEALLAVLLGLSPSTCSAPRDAAVEPLAPSTPIVASATTVPAPPAPPINSSASALPQATATTSARPPAQAAAPPAALRVPATIRPGEKRPFVLFLHGFGASGKVLVDHLHVDAIAADRRFVYATPDGALDSKGRRFWNASPACCDFENKGPSHVESLQRLLASAAAHPSVDPKRVYVLGFSNGGFMAHRLACEVPGIAAIASVAGAGPAAGEACPRRGATAVLQVHGDADPIIAFGGGHALGRADRPRHASALDTVKAWAERNGCGALPAAGGTLDIESKLEGPETRVVRFGGCQRAVELWTVEGGNHFVGLERPGADAILTFLERHSSP